MMSKLLLQTLNLKNLFLHELIIKKDFDTLLGYLSIFYNRILKCKLMKKITKKFYISFFFYTYRV